jgi:predicted DNA-binding antitoxin AbrB/MazE fold protein
MTKTIHAVYANGVFRPVEPVDLPDQTPVEFEVRVLSEAHPTGQAPMSEGLAKIYEILGRRYSSGCTDTAARHNEHQP